MPGNTWHGRPCVYRGAVAEHIPGRLQVAQRANVPPFHVMDLLAAAKVQCWKEGLRVRFHVHDELVVSVKEEWEGRRAMEIMSTPPAWAKDFPILVEADTMPRYSKTAPWVPGPVKWASYNYENGVAV